MKINLTTLGCPKNLVDSELLLGGLKGSGVEFVDNAALADTIILNTCGFIQGAKEESIDAILQAVELKRIGNCKKVFVTGCLSQRYPQALQNEIPEVDGFYGNRDINRIVRELLTELDLKREILGERLLSGPKHFAYLKISEGCENPCTFCSIPAIRGHFVSKPIEAVLDEARMLAENGARELIVIAQDTTIYGQDLYGEKRIVELLSRLADIAEFKWIRLLYTYPAHFSEALINLIGQTPKINYVDIPVQHSSNCLLQKMARKVKRQDLEKIINGLRAGNPDIAIRSTFIVGFPGETREDQHDLCDFLETMRFDRLGFFGFSKEEDTPAYHFKEQVPDYIIQQRLAELTDLQNGIAQENEENMIGKQVEVAVDEYDSALGCFLARSSKDCPEIDETIQVEAKGLKPGDFTRVKIIASSDDGLRAELAPSHIERGIR